MATEVTVTGLDQLYRNLQEIPVNIEKNIMVGSLRAGLNVYKKRAQENCPVKTGDLKKSIRVSIRRKKYTGRLNGYLRAGDKKAWYSHIIEFGSGSFYAGTGTKSLRAPYVIKPKERGGGLFFLGITREQVIHPGIHPKPFMRQALDAGLDEPLTAVADYIRARLAREAGRT